jgi:hypothetical protein
LRITKISEGKLRKCGEQRKKSPRPLDKERYGGSK